MKRFPVKQGFMALLGLVALLGFAGCDDAFDDSPDNISGAWSCTFTRSGETTLYETWVFNQNGDSVTGSYTFKGETFTFVGTYDDGDFRATDSDNWSLRLDFDDDDEGEGSIAGTAASGVYQVWDADLSR